MKVVLLAITLVVCSSWVSGKSAYPFKGCYKDESNRDMKEGVFVDYNTHEYCANRCLGKGYKFFGVQNGQDCWCGNSYGKHGRVPYYECAEVPCTGNAKEHCGGSLRNAVFATQASDSVSKLEELINEVDEIDDENDQLEDEFEQLQNNLEEEVKNLKSMITVMESQMKELTYDHCPLGMENNFIADSQITASSHWDSTYLPKKGRLNSVWDESGYAAWVPSSNNHNGGWIQVDLLTPKTVTGIITQGRGDNKYGIQYMKTFNVYYGDSPSNIHAMVDSAGRTKVFSGNFDRNTKVVNMFENPIKARYVRVVAKSWYTHVAVRLELLSC